jgi:hypothetical protein
MAIVFSLSFNVLIKFLGNVLRKMVGVFHLQQNERGMGYEGVHFLGLWVTVGFGEWVKW